VKIPYPSELRNPVHSKHSPFLDKKDRNLSLNGVGFIFALRSSAQFSVDPCREAFSNLMSELWYSSKALVRQGQLRNMGPSAILEMCARSYDETRGRIVVEPKEKMKLRTKRSPDIADATFLSVFIARKKHNLLGNEKFPTVKEPPQSTEFLKLTGGNPNHPLASINSWAEKRRRMSLEDNVYVPPGGGWDSAQDSSWAGKFG